MLRFGRSRGSQARTFLKFQSIVTCVTTTYIQFQTFCFNFKIISFKMLYIWLHILLTGMHGPIPALILKWVPHYHGKRSWHHFLLRNVLTLISIFRMTIFLWWKAMSDIWCHFSDHGIAILLITTFVAAIFDVQFPTSNLKYLSYNIVRFPPNKPVCRNFTKVS